MKNKLKQFIDEEFMPFGSFPSRDEIKKEILSNLEEKYLDLKLQGLSEEEAYNATIETFGNVREIMENFQYDSHKHNNKEESGIHKAFGEFFGIAKNKSSRFKYIMLNDSDLSNISLVGEDFSGSAIANTVFDKSNLTKAIFRGADLKGTSFKESILVDTEIAACDLKKVCFDMADLTNTKLKACDLKETSFINTKLVNTEFSQSDLSNLNFMGLKFDHVAFNGSSLKGTSFKNSIFNNVSFHHSVVKEAIFDGTIMDKATYALLKGIKANLENVIIK